MYTLFNINLPPQQNKDQGIAGILTLLYHFLTYGWQIQKAFKYAHELGLNNEKRFCEVNISVLQDEIGKHFSFETSFFPKIKREGSYDICPAKIVIWQKQDGTIVGNFSVIDNLTMQTISTDFNIPYEKVLELFPKAKEIIDLPESERSTWWTLPQYANLEGIKHEAKL